MSFLVRVSKTEKSEQISFFVPCDVEFEVLIWYADPLSLECTGVLAYIVSVYRFV